ncbi:hypothetical protein B0I33_101320 [Prauserella shujinwangii]|uniref:Uncharacterized protein n=2 Tax=Prauserella shujinwangii TaxID=1453103 RepID=A0A2T0M360_9PSEU|nr:hypothetical protein B0I33_101320 [Prauserella shujinwangii]
MVREWGLDGLQAEVAYRVEDLRRAGRGGRAARAARAARPWRRRGSGVRRVEVPPQRAGEHERAPERAA